MWRAVRVELGEAVDVSVSDGRAWRSVRAGPVGSIVCVGPSRRLKKEVGVVVLMGPSWT